MARIDYRVHPSEKQVIAVKTMQKKVSKLTRVHLNIRYYNKYDCSHAINKLKNLLYCLDTITFLK